MSRVSQGLQLHLLSPRQALLASAIAGLTGGTRRPRDIFVAISGGEARATPLRMLDYLRKTSRSAKTITHDDIVELFKSYTRVDPRRGLTFNEFNSLCDDICLLDTRREASAREQEKNLQIPDAVEYLKNKILGYMEKHKLSEEDMFRELDTSHTGVVRPQQLKKFINRIKIWQPNKPGTADNFMKMKKHNETLTEEQWISVFQYLQSFDRSPNMQFKKFTKLLSYSNPRRAKTAESSLPSLRYGHRLKPHVSPIGDPNYVDTFPTIQQGETYEERRQRNIDVFSSSLKQTPVELPSSNGRREIVQEVDTSPNRIFLPNQDYETNIPGPIELEPNGVSVMPGKAVAFMAEPTKAELPVGGFAPEKASESLLSILNLIREKIYQRVQNPYSLFQLFNVSKTGILTFDELRHGLGSVNIGLSRNDLENVLRYGNWLKDTPLTFSMDYRTFCDFLGNSLTSTGVFPTPKNTSELYGRVEPRRSTDIKTVTPSRHDGLNDSMNSSRIKSIFNYGNSETSSTDVFNRSDNGKFSNNTSTGSAMTSTEKLYKCNNGLGLTHRSSALKDSYATNDYKYTERSQDKKEDQIYGAQKQENDMKQIGGGYLSSNPPPNETWGMGLHSSRNIPVLYEQNVKRNEINNDNKHNDTITGGINEKDKTVSQNLSSTNKEHELKIMQKHIHKMATNLRDKMIQRYKTAAQLFNVFDEERLGGFNIVEFRNKLHTKFGFDYSDDDADRLFSLINTTGSGYITLKEFAVFLEI